MNPTTPNPTFSMSFIAGLLVLMSVFSLFAPKKELSSPETPSDNLAMTQVEEAMVRAY